MQTFLTIMYSRFELYKVSIQAHANSQYYIHVLRSTFLFLKTFCLNKLYLCRS